MGESQRERETQNRKQAPGSEPSAQSPTRARTHGPRDRDLAEVGRLTDCATQAPHPPTLKEYYSTHTKDPITGNTCKL